MFVKWLETSSEIYTQGRVSVLSYNVNAFRAQLINSTIRLSIDSNRTVRGGNPVRLSKQKVVF